jgi:hypothetical protein
LAPESSQIDNPDDDPFTESQEKVLSPTPRDSVTTRRLGEKRAREATFTPQKVSRAEVFGSNTCSERLCDNKTKCCFVMPQAGTHHKISIDKQLEWAAAINAKAPGVTVKRPPLEWLIAFAEGDCRTSYRPKLSGARKSDQTLQETTAKPNTTSLEQVTQLLLLQMVDKMAARASEPTPSTIVYVPGPSTEQEPGSVLQSKQASHAQILANSVPNSAPGLPGQGSVPTPSSPLKPPDDDTNEVEEMGVWIIGKEKNSKRKELLERAFELLEDAFVIDLSQLSDVQFVTSLEIKPGIAHFISSHISEFKKVYNVRKAAEDLLNLHGSALGRQYMSGEGSGEGSGENDEFADYFVEY